jgi:hypothetical protein
MVLISSKANCSEKGWHRDLPGRKPKHVLGHWCAPEMLDSGSVRDDTGGVTIIIADGYTWHGEMAYH